MSDAKSPDVSQPLYWPAEWAVDRGFWREVAARTLAGVLTLVTIGVPSLIYAAASGVLTFDQVGPILIGVALVVLGAVAYVLVLRSIGRRGRRKIAEAISVAEARLRSPSLTAAQIKSISAQRSEEIDRAQKRLRVTVNLVSLAALLVTAVTVLWPISSN
jgi:hypothetical protein